MYLNFAFKLCICSANSNCRAVFVSTVSNSSMLRFWNAVSVAFWKSLKILYQETGRGINGQPHKPATVIQKKINLIHKTRFHPDHFYMSPAPPNSKLHMHTIIIYTFLCSIRWKSRNVDLCTNPCAWEWAWGTIVNYINPFKCTELKL